MLSDDYKLVDQLEVLGVPSLLKCQLLKITGRVHLAEGVVIVGDVEIENAAAERKTLVAGVYQDQRIVL